MNSLRTSKGFEFLFIIFPFLSYHHFTRDNIIIIVVGIIIQTFNLWFFFLFVFRFPFHFTLAVSQLINCRQIAFVCLFVCVYVFIHTHLYMHVYQYVSLCIFYKMILFNKNAPKQQKEFVAVAVVLLEEVVALGSYSIKMLHINCIALKLLNWVHVTFIYALKSIIIPQGRGKWYL